LLLIESDKKQINTVILQVYMISLIHKDDETEKLYVNICTLIKSLSDKAYTTIQFFSECENKTTLLRKIMIK